MPPIKTPRQLITVDESGTAWISGTTYPVLDPVLDHLAYGWSPEEICYQHYHELTLAQVYAALSYYYDHEAIMDAEIKADVEWVERLRREAGESPVHRKLKLKGLLP